MLMVQEKTTAVAMYERGQLDFLDDHSIPALEKDRLSKQRGFKRVPQLRGEYYGFAVDRKPFNDPRVRKAFAMLKAASRLSGRAVCNGYSHEMPESPRVYHGGYDGLHGRASGRQLPGRSLLRLRRSQNTGVLTMARLNMQPSEGVRNPLVLCSLVFIVFISAAGLLAPWISPYGAGGFEESRILETPSWAHLMGTDGLGRDLLTRVLYGARVSMAVGIGTAMIALVIGTAYGLASGFTGGNLDHLMMRAVDIFYGLPDMLIFILLSLLLGRNIGGLLIALGLVSWVRFARMARGQMLQAKEFLFVEGARAMPEVRDWRWDATPVR